MNAAGTDHGPASPQREANSSRRPPASRTPFAAIQQGGSKPNATRRIHIQHADGCAACGRQADHQSAIEREMVMPKLRAWVGRRPSQFPIDEECPCLGLQQGNHIGFLDDGLILGLFRTGERAFIALARQFVDASLGLGIGAETR